jgi:hypothetical protein
MNAMGDVLHHCQLPVGKGLLIGEKESSRLGKVTRYLAFFASVWLLLDDDAGNV